MKTFGEIFSFVFMLFPLHFIIALGFYVLHLIYQTDAKIDHFFVFPYDIFCFVGIGTTTMHFLFKITHLVFCDAFARPNDAYTILPHIRLEKWHIWYSVMHFLCKLMHLTFIFQLADLTHFSVRFQCIELSCIFLAKWHIHSVVMHSSGKLLHSGFF